MMNKLGILALAAQAAPRLFQVQRRTWIGIGVGLLVLFGLLIWAAVALIGWLWGQSQGWMDKAPETARGALSQVEQVVPGARETLGQFVPALKPEAKPQRDVSGTDLAPVARYPGLARTDWQRWGKQVTIEYEGEADYATVLDYYTKGFAAQGFAQTLQSASRTTETHDYTKGNERITTTIAQKSKNGISVKINLTLQ
jgi:hypothetical protein